MDMTTQLEQIRREYETNNARFAEQVMVVLDGHGLGELVRKKLNGHAVPEPAATPAKPTPATKATQPKATVKAGVRSCKVPGCGKKHLAKGFCGLHWSRDNRGVPLDGPVSRKKPAPPPKRTVAASGRGCSFAGCKQPHKAKGLCNAHYLQSLRGAGGCTPRAEKERAHVAAVADDKEHRPAKAPHGMEPANQVLTNGQKSGQLGNPTKFVGAHAPDKHPDCEVYANCLEYAYDQRWLQWSCAGCSGPGVQNMRGEARYGGAA